MLNYLIGLLVWMVGGFVITWCALAIQYLSTYFTCTPKEHIWKKETVDYYNYIYFRILRKNRATPMKPYNLIRNVMLNLIRWPYVLRSLLIACSTIRTKWIDAMTKLQAGL